MRQTEARKSGWILVLVVALLLLFPFDVKTMNALGTKTTLYKAALCSVIRSEALGLVKTKFYFFPSNLDANNNFETLSNSFKDLNDLFNEVIK